MTVRELKRGEWFTLKPIPEPKPCQVFIRGEYFRSTKKFCACQWDDMNKEKYLKPDTVVYTDFIF